MPKRDVNADNRLAELLVELKRHLRVCRYCQGAIKTRDRSMLCEHTIGLILTAASRYDQVIPRRIAAKRRGDHHVFSCPDISAHGKSFAMTAEPLVVIGVESTLF
jgi:recombinational DNA repair protein RecR